MRQIPVDEQLLEALAQAAPSSALPLVRNHLYMHTFDWLKRRGVSYRRKSTEKHGEHDTESCCGGLSALAFSSVRRLVIFGLTDVWSATRKGCAGRLAAIALLLNRVQLESLAAGLLDRYQQASAASAPSIISASSSPNTGGGGHARQEWRDKEGCLLGLAALLRLPRWSLGGGDPTDGSGGGAGLPAILQERLAPILFQAGRTPKPLPSPRA